ncbi:unnamed protein product (macronuclear) [Paramecium tetraurelia]|uniref:ABC-2 type transporter domain-containing protein n=1 Tax=Paramecium tetraurelia TaxID=5888 RepID=A0BBJ9_PARTE|nr:uncharacterized protein GSPATT00000351001 [Paramecium tetraurelia]CAK55916.1 unnamed protein product [Paramecium tetraurelia]|eukprot:XP_001423314.1 hypothetical protein (macronuclear) [Paramecium tetraurelia strain d4-2]
MYIQLYAIPGQIFLGMFAQFTYDFGVIYYLCMMTILISLYACIYISSSQLFPRCLWMIVPFQMVLTIMNFDMVSAGIIPYLILTDQINSDIIIRLPKKPIPPPRRSFNAQIDNQHSIHIQNVIKQNAQSLKKYEYFHIGCITLCYIAIPKYNCTRMLTIQKTLHNCQILLSNNIITNQIIIQLCSRQSFPQSNLCYVH